MQIFEKKICNIILKVLFLGSNKNNEGNSINGIKTSFSYFRHIHPEEMTETRAVISTPKQRRRQTGGRKDERVCIHCLSNASFPSLVVMSAGRAACIVGWQITSALLKNSPNRVGMCALQASLEEKLIFLSQCIQWR